MTRGPHAHTDPVIFLPLAAALSITTLYKSSLRTSKRAYHAGYSAACQDLLLMIQQGVSAGESSDGNGMTIGRIMDYIEARLEAIKSREEEEDEDEEKDKERDRERRLPPSALSKVPSGTALNVKSSSATNHPPAKSRESVCTTLPSFCCHCSRISKVVSAPMTPLSPPPSTAGPAPPASPSPPSQATMRLPFPQSFMPGQRNSKSRLFTISSVNQKEAAMSSSTVPGGLLSAPADAPLAIIPPPSTPMMSHFSSYPSPESTGTKRRHAAISSDSSSSTSPPHRIRQCEAPHS